MQKKGLGRGLDALITDPAVGRRDGTMTIRVDEIRPNRKQPRRDFDPERLEELASSIREHGVVQPILVRPLGNGYELVAGERRWRAAQLAGRETIPAVVRDVTPAESMAIALIENLQREDLNPIEEGEAYRSLMDEFGLTQDEVGQRVGKSRPYIANTVRLLQLPAAVQELVSTGRLSGGHAKVLLGMGEAEEQLRLAQVVVAEGLSVRDLEGRIGAERESARRPGRTPKRHSNRDPEVVRCENELRELYGTPVKVVPGQTRGRVEVYFYGDEDMARVLELLMGRRPDGRGPGRGDRRLTV